MPNVFTEARPKGRTEGSPIKGYVVEDHADDELESSKRRTKRSDGPCRKVTSRTWPVFGPSMTRRSQILGGPSRQQRLGF